MIINKLWHIYDAGLGYEVLDANKEQINNGVESFFYKDHAERVVLCLNACAGLTEKQITQRGDALRAIKAIARELDRRGITYDVIDSASKNSGVDVLSVATAHLKEDIARLQNDLGAYSLDERRVLAQLLGVK